jgi:hypothetical protein
VDEVRLATRWYVDELGPNEIEYTWRLPRHRIACPDAIGPMWEPLPREPHQRRRQVQTEGLDLVSGLGRPGADAFHEQPVRTPYVEERAIPMNRSRNGTPRHLPGSQATTFA